MLQLTSAVLQTIRYSFSTIVITVYFLIESYLPMILLFSPGSEVCPYDKSLPLLSLSKPIPAFRVQDKNKITLEHHEVGLVGNLVRESLVSELHKRFSGAIKERDCSTKKPKDFKAKGDHSPKMFRNSQLEMCSLRFHTKRLTDGERQHENVLISGVFTGESPVDVPSVIKYEETDRENLLLETSQRTPTMLPLPGLVDKLIKSPFKRDCISMCADTKAKLVENLWQDRNIVRDSGILHRLSKGQLKLQEVP